MIANLSQIIALIQYLAPYVQPTEELIRGIIAALGMGLTEDAAKADLETLIREIAAASAEAQRAADGTD